jgi:hypothetical protein
MRTTMTKSALARSVAIASAPARALSSSSWDRRHQHAQARCTGFIGGGNHDRIGQRGEHEVVAGEFEAQPTAYKLGLGLAVRIGLEVDGATARGTDAEWPARAGRRRESSHGVAVPVGPMFPNAEQSETDIAAQMAAPPMVMTTSES